MVHQLTKTKNGWECSLCKWKWKTKPSIKCPEIPRYKWGCQPAYLKTKIDLHKKNLKPLCNAAGCIYNFKKSKYIWLFDENQTELDNPELPSIISWEDRDRLGLLTISQLRKQNLVPGDATQRCVGWVFDSEQEWGKWIELYHPDDCTWESSDNYITKTQLKQRYLLSSGWIKRVGEPDKLADNPKNWRHPIQLYSRKRVEKFLANNAELYSNWLDKRDKYLEIFEQNKDKVLLHRDLIRNQTRQCMNCASGAALADGFLCAIHPGGLAVDKMPCQDFYRR